DSLSAAHLNSLLPCGFFGNFAELHSLSMLIPSDPASTATSRSANTRRNVHLQTPSPSPSPSPSLFPLFPPSPTASLPHPLCFTPSASKSSASILSSLASA